jgi:hypothetical protein
MGIPLPLAILTNVTLYVLNAPGSPFQVALSFDDAAMEVLGWLEDSSLEWDRILRINSVF